MENLEGRSLDVIMRDFTEEDICRLALHMLSALKDLHRQNIIHRDVGTHRDVKPSNIVLCGADYKLVLITSSLTSGPEKSLLRVKKT